MLNNCWEVRKISEKLLNYTQIGRKRQIERVINIIRGVGGVAGIAEHKRQGTYTDFVSYVAYELGASRKLSEEYIRIAIDAARFKAISLNGKDLLESGEEIV